MSATKTDARTSGQTTKSPVLQVTRYDRVSSTMLAVFMGMGAAVFGLMLLWLSSRPHQIETHAPVEFLPGGGYEDGSPDETLQLDSPDDPAEDPALADVVSDETMIQEQVETIQEMSLDASQIVQEQTLDNPENQGNPGSASGTGRRPLGYGNVPGRGGMPPEQRWFVRFSDQGTLDEYAAQLDYFKIELGAILGGDRIVYLSNMSSPTPQTRTVNTGKNEKRLYMTWQAGQRKSADVAMFKKANIDASNAIIFHFYAPETEQLLLKLEHDYQNRPVSQIRRTYFTVRGTGGGYRFVVTRQVALK